MLGSGPTRAAPGGEPGSVPSDTRAMSLQGPHRSDRKAPEGPGQGRHERECPRHWTTAELAPCICTKLVVLTTALGELNHLRTLSQENSRKLGRIARILHEKGDRP